MIKQQSGVILSYRNNEFTVTVGKNRIKTNSAIIALKYFNDYVLKVLDEK